jgi:hypothetical protein
MSERIGLSFADGSILVLPEGTTIEMAQKEAEEHDTGSPKTTQVAKFYIRVLQAIREDR